MSLLVTGGAGFIGRNFVLSGNYRGWVQQQYGQEVTT